MKKLFLTASGLTLAFSLVACSTSYHLPVPDQTHAQAASRLFSEAKAQPIKIRVSATVAERRFRRVAARVIPIAEKYCESLTADKEGVNCSADVGIERELDYANAFLVQGVEVDTKEVVSFIRITMPMLRQATSDDEVAFILGHEFGHLIARHPQKQQNQAIAGAIIGGLLTGDVHFGMNAGVHANAQEFELEGDVLGARITHAAGYDPVKGAAFFARSGGESDAKRPGFWITHPPNSKRLEMVLATVSEIERGQEAAPKNF